MRKFPGKAVVVLLFFTVIAAYWACNTPEGKPSETSGADTSVERGKYLVTVMGCDDCHSPKIFGPEGPHPDPDRQLSGHPASEKIGKVDTSVLRNWVYFNHHTTATVGPWGVSYSANITSDPTGIGNWTEEQFFTAIRKGKFKGLENGRMLLPPMPWFNYAKATDEDLKAIFKYLKSTKPVSNVVPAALRPDQVNQN